jgi:hypothetical protein
MQFNIINLKNYNLGFDDNTDRNLPTLVPLLSNIIQISTSAFSTLALNQSGFVFCFGKNTVLLK